MSEKRDWGGSNPKRPVSQPTQPKREFVRPAAGLRPKDTPADPEPAAASSAPPPTPEPTPPTPAAASNDLVHTVVAGESLSLIAEKYYGGQGAWQRIYEANKEVIGDNPRLIRPGQKLRIPGIRAR